MLRVVHDFWPIDQGVAATRAVLPSYDTGGWGLYAPGEDAPVRPATTRNRKKS